MRKIFLMFLCSIILSCSSGDDVKDNNDIKIETILGEWILDNCSTSIFDKKTGELLYHNDNEEALDFHIKLFENGTYIDYEYDRVMTLSYTLKGRTLYLTNYNPLYIEKCNSSKMIIKIEGEEFNYNYQRYIKYTNYITLKKVE